MFFIFSSVKGRIGSFHIVEFSFFSLQIDELLLGQIYPLLCITCSNNFENECSWISAFMEPLGNPGFSEPMKLGFRYVLKCPSRPM